MDSAEDSFLLDYLDEVSLRVAFGESPEEAPAEIWEYRFVPPQGWSERQVLANLEALLRDAPGGPYAFMFRASRSVVSWGADAATLTLVGYVALQALNALIGMGVEGGLKGVYKILAGHDPDSSRIPDRQEMLGIAQWRAADGYGVEYDSLRLVSEERRPVDGTSTFVFEDDRARYTVELGVVSRIPTTSRLRRDLKD